jgi:hypothetical protein
MAVAALLCAATVMVACSGACARAAPRPDPRGADASVPSATASASAASSTPWEGLELRLSLQGEATARADSAIPIELALVNRTPSTRFWLGGSISPPVAFCTAQQQEDDGRWSDVPATPVDQLCGPRPLEWTVPVNAIEPGAAWRFEAEFEATTARCAGQQRKFIGFRFPRPGKARLFGHYRYPGHPVGAQQPFGAPTLPPTTLVSEPVELRVVP